MVSSRVPVRVKRLEVQCLGIAGFRLLGSRALLNRGLRCVHKVLHGFAPEFAAVVNSLKGY